MKKNINIKEGFAQRYTAFLEHFDLNPNKLANLLNDPARVKYHKYKTGESEPNSTSLFQIASEFPVSIDWLILGQGEMIRGSGFPSADLQEHGTISAPVSDTAEEIIMRLTVELEKMSARYDKLEQRYDMTQARYMHLNDAIIKEKAPELSFLKSGSRSTARATGNAFVDGQVTLEDQKDNTFRKIGFEVGKNASVPAPQNQTEAKVMPLWPSMPIIPIYIAALQA